MHFSPFADMGDSIAYLLEGFRTGTIIFLLTVFAEGAGMRYLEWDSLRRCMIDSFIMNAVSLGAGFLMICSLLSVPFLQLAADFMLLTLPGVLLSFVIGWILSVAIEGVTMKMLRKKPPETTFRTMFIVNTLSYVGLIILFFIYSGGPGVFSY